MTEETETPKSADVAGRLDGLVGHKDYPGLMRAADLCRGLSAKLDAALQEYRPDSVTAREIESAQNGVISCVARIEEAIKSLPNSLLDSSRIGS